MTFTVYALFDARELDRVRYVGFSREPAVRFRHHLYEALKTSSKSHRLNWIRKVIDDGSTVVWKTLAVVTTAGDAAQAEIRCIAEHVSAGHPLTNGTEGGEGVQGFGGMLSAEALERRNLTMNSPEYLAKRSEQSAAYWTSEEARDHQRDAMEQWWASPEGQTLKQSHSVKAKAMLLERPGYMHTDSARQKMRTAKLGKPHAKPRTAEWNAKIAAAQKGKKRRPWTPEERDRHMGGMNREKMSASAKARGRATTTSTADTDLFDRLTSVQTENERYQQLYGPLPAKDPA